MPDEDVLFLKYNAVLEKSIGLTIAEMVLQRKDFLPNYKDGESGESEFIPAAEVSLIGINNDGIDYNLTEDIFDNRQKLVAWECGLDITPFEDNYMDTYFQKVTNVSFDDINSNFKVSDVDGIDHCYITDIMLTSNDPRYQLVVDSVYMFEFDKNATLYDSEVFDTYPTNHFKQIYYGNYSDLYDIDDDFYSMSVNLSEVLPIYAYNLSIDETLYIEAFDSDGNYYYPSEHFTLTNSSFGTSER